MTHVDDFVDDPGRRDEGELYARWFFFLHRLPAIKKASFGHWISQFRLFCTFECKRWRVVGASRMGDVWLTEDFDSEQYQRRVDLDDCSEWSDAPDGDIVEAFAKVRAELKAQGITVHAGDWPEIRTGEPGETLWCVHVLGPDTVIPQPDKATAEKHAAKWNAQIAKMFERRPRTEYDSILECVVEPWPYDAEGHAKEVAEHGGEPEDIC